MRPIHMLDSAKEVNSEYNMSGTQNKESIAVPGRRMKIAASHKEGSIEPKQARPGNNQITFDNKFPVVDLESWEVEPLIDHIIDKHHKFSRKNAVIIYDLSQAVAYECGKNQREIKQLTSSMFLFLHDYLNNLKKEEEILFPKIRYLVEKNARSERVLYSTFGLVQQWINATKDEHQSMVKYLQLFHELTNDYSLTDDASSSYTTLFDKLKQFEADFILHSYIENEILFPRVPMEDELTFKTTSHDSETN